MYRLHYAPDNASLAVRLLLESLGCAYETCLVDRARRAQDGAAYRAINPAGKIPALETPHGAIFETAAILLWLEERHTGAAPAAGTPQRGDFLKWLFFASNTLHADLRLVFYPQDSVGDDPTLTATLHAHVTRRLCRHFSILDDAAGAGLCFFNGPEPTALDFYVASCMRWAALYGPGGTEWYHACTLPHLTALAMRLEALPAVHRTAAAEGLGPTPFSAPQPCKPPEGSAV